MMKQDNDILTKCGNRRPFSVPDNYFDGLDARIMNALPQRAGSMPEQSVTTWMKLRPYLYMAAAFAGLYFGIGLFAGQKDKSGVPDSTTDITVYSDEYIDSFLDESMVSDYMIYDLLVNNDQ